MPVPLTVKESLRKLETSMCRVVRNILNGLGAHRQRDRQTDGQNYDIATECVYGLLSWWNNALNSE